MRAGRLALLALAGLCLLGGLSAGLLLLGLPAPIRLDRLPEVHGQLMVFGFMGTLICFERAVALRRASAYAAPVLIAAGALLLLTPLPLAAGHAVLLAGLAGFTLIHALLWRRQPTVAGAIQVLGAVLATGAGILWLGQVRVEALFPWLAAFIVLTIAGERLELSAVGAPARSAEVSLLAASAALALSAPAALLWPAPGSALVSLCLLGVAGWLLLHDVALRTVRSTGLPRYSAVTMLCATAWLSLAGVIWLLAGPLPAAPAAGTVIHSVLLGFGMSMILAHAPIILPALLRRPVPYRPVLYLPVALLQGSLALRVVADQRDLVALWQAAGVLNVVALLAFLLTVVVLAVRR